jgi:uncharacterized protein YdeI (BOF family)
MGMGMGMGMGMMPMMPGMMVPGMMPGMFFPPHHHGVAPVVPVVKGNTPIISIGRDGRSNEAEEEEVSSSRYEEAPDPRNCVETKLDPHCNMNVILAGNIVSSDYYKTLSDHKTFRDIMEEIQTEVKHLGMYVIVSHHFLFVRC